MRFVSLGCSMMFGYSDVNLDHRITKQNSLVYQVSKMYNAEYLNLAVCGGGNGLIYERLLTNSLKLNPDKDFIVIGWTESFRRKLFFKNEVDITYRPYHTTQDTIREFIEGLYEKNEFFSTIPIRKWYEIYNNEKIWPDTLSTKRDDKEFIDAGIEEYKSLLSDTWINPNMNYYDTLMTIISAYNFLKSNGFKFIMLDALEVIGKEELKNCTIDYYYIPKELLELYKNIPNYIRGEVYQKVIDKVKGGTLSDGHPSAIGAKFYAKKLYKEINKLYEIK